MLPEPEQRFWLEAEQPFWVVREPRPLGRYVIELGMESLKEMCKLALRTFDWQSWPVAMITTKNAKESRHA